MNGYESGTWTKGGKKITGQWRWSHWLQRFQITLDAKDEITGRKRTFEVSGDNPNFNGWKLVEDDK